MIHWKCVDTKPPDLPSLNFVVPAVQKALAMVL